MLIPIFSGLYQAFLNLSSQFTLKDIFEISTLSFATYAFLKWIRSDNQKYLLYYCYTYLSCFALSYWIHLPVLQHLLFLFLPVAVLIFITLHQKTLQKNFITLNAVQPSRKNLYCDDWQEIIIRTTLTALNKKKNCFFIIESKDSLYEFLSVPYFLQAQISKELLDIFIENSTAKESMFWISNGSIKAIDTNWKINQEDLWQENSSNQIEQNVQIALMMSKNSDCIVLYSYNNKPGLNFIAQGKLSENLSATHAQALLKKYTIDYSKGETAHEYQSFQNPKC